MARVLELTPDGDRKRREGELWLSHEDVRDGDGHGVVDLMHEGQFRGRGFYSREDPVAVRVVSRSKTEVDGTFFRERIANAQHRRRVLGDRRSYRLVHGHADFLPGLVVDRYGPTLVVQFRHPVVEDCREEVVDALVEQVSPRSIYARNDVAARSRAGLDRYRGLLWGEPVPDRVKVQTTPYTLVADVKGGQKTGFYLDQIDNRSLFGKYVAGARGVDCFCYSGGWGFRALHGGAREVLFVDQSETALDLVRENARLNDWSDRVRTRSMDAFDYLNELRKQNGEGPDFLVLDPPSFARSTDGLGDALRGYKEINLRAMQALKPEGLLATSSCTAPVDRERFLTVLDDSAHDAHVECRVLEEGGQGPDHPWLTRLPSTRYLTVFVCEIGLL